MVKPLEGLLVVSLEQAVAAPFCSSRLADAGARVIKVERHDGDFARRYDALVDGGSAYFVWLNRGKESICLDIKDSTESALLLRMIDRADVFIQNLAPDAASRAGLGSDELRERNQRLITVDISGYGDTGPYRDMKAYDLLVQCESGLAAITGTAAEPGRVGVSICDIACGMFAHAAVLEALIERSKTGRGSGIKVSLFDAIADWMTVPLLQYDYGGVVPSRIGLHHPSIAPYGQYLAGDGQGLVIAVQNEREWISFCKRVLRRPELASKESFDSNINRCRNRAELDSEITAVFSQLSGGQIRQRLESAKIAFANLNSVAQLSEHKQLRRVEVRAPSGPVRVVAPPAIHERPPILGAVPDLNEHGELLRAEFGR